MTVGVTHLVRFARDLVVRNRVGQPTESAQPTARMVGCASQATLTHPIKEQRSGKGLETRGFLTDHKGCGSCHQFGGYRTFTRSHALRGNAVFDALRRSGPAEIRTQSVQDGIPTEDRGNELGIGSPSNW
jgi:hypothetical protein